MIAFPPGVSAETLLWAVTVPGQDAVQKSAAEIGQALGAGTDWQVHHGGAWKKASEHGFSVTAVPSTPPAAPPAAPSPPPPPRVDTPPSEGDAIQAQIEELQRQKAAQEQAPPPSSPAAEELRKTLGG